MQIRKSLKFRKIRKSLKFNMDLGEIHFRNENWKKLAQADVVSAVLNLQFCSCSVVSQFTHSELQYFKILSNSI